VETILNLETFKTGLHETVETKGLSMVVRIYVHLNRSWKSVLTWEDRKNHLRTVVLNEHLSVLVVSNLYICNNKNEFSDLSHTTLSGSGLRYDILSPISSDSATPHQYKMNGMSVDCKINSSN
jgi:hypothetical protein